MEIIITSIIAFASTNIDDIFILTLFYGNRKFSNKQIITGQFLGIICLIAVSLAGSLTGFFINEAYIGLLGLLPIYLGVKAIWTFIKNKEKDTQLVDQQSNNGKSNALTIAGITIANGADNIGIYVPLFASLSWTNKISMVIIFLIMTFLWCLIAKYFARHPYVARSVDKHGHFITPILLILLGIYILLKSGSFELLS